jgi:hypothetical protein
LLTKEPDFWIWAAGASPVIYPKSGLSESNTDAWLKAYLGIGSKSELDASSHLQNLFADVEGSFFAWKQAKGHGQLER